MKGKEMVKVMQGWVVSPLEVMKYILTGFTWAGDISIR